MVRFIRASPAISGGINEAMIVPKMLHCGRFHDEVIRSLNTLYINILLDGREGAGIVSALVHGIDARILAVQRKGFRTPHRSVNNDRGAA